MRPRAAPMGLVAAGVLLVALAAGEAAQRAWTRETPRERRVTAAIERDLKLLAPCASLEGGAQGTRVVGRSTAPGRAFDYPLARTPGTLRVAVAGESSGTMLGAAMKDLVARSANAPVEILNCASPGAALEHVATRAREAMTYAPDVLVIAFGHDLDIHAPMDAWRLGLEYWLRRSRLLGRVLDARSRPDSPRPAMPERIARMTHWLHQLAREARDRGITVIVQTLPANLWVPPAAGREALEDPEFLQARLEYARGSRVAAMQRLAAYAGKRDDPHLRFVLGTWLARSGDRKRAREHLQAAVDLAGPAADLASSAVNDAIRRVAEEDSLVLRDTERAVSTLARQGIPGWDVMRDHRHLKPELVEAEAREILLLARRAVGPDTPFELSDWSKAWSARTEMQRALESVSAALARSTGAGAERWAHAAGYAVELWLSLGYEEVDAAVDAYLDGPVFASLAEPERRACLLTAIAEGYWNGGRKERAIALSDRALSAQSAEARTERALLELGRGRTDAARELLAGALSLDEARADARFYLERIGQRRTEGSG